MLVILAMDPLQRLLDTTTTQEIITSMYADDAAIFINPIKEDVEAVKIILQAFGTFSGPHINLEKALCIQSDVKM